MRPYETYKQSNIEWLGEIPEHWHLSKLKYVTSLNGNDETDENVSSGDEGIFRVALENIESGTGKYIATNEEQAFEGAGNFFKNGDVLFNKLRPYLAKVYLAEQNGISVGELLVLSPSVHLTSKFLHYSLLSSAFIEIVNSSTYGSKMPRANWDFIGNLKMPIPSTLEQTRITFFLDYQTNIIDSLITKQQRLIELLKEKWKSVINESVIKGLNPNVAMRDSGAEWLGEIPEHWRVTQIKYIAELNPSKSEIADHFGPDTIVSFLPMEKVGEDWSYDLTSNTRLGDVSSGLTYFSNGDIIIAKITPCFENGKGALLSGLMNGIGFGSTEFHTIRPQRINAKLLFYVTRSDYFMANGESFMTGSAGQKRVPTSFINEFFVPLPMEVEQEEIVTYLDEYISRSNFLVQQIELQIEKLKEYRQSLISEAVTGKIDLRDWEPVRDKQEA